MAKAPPKEPKVTDLQRAYAAAYLEHGDKKRAAREAGYTSWETGFCTIHKQRGVQHAMMQMAAEMRQEAPITPDYVLASLHEVAERCMQARPLRDSRGNQVFQKDDEGNKVAALFTFNATSAIHALTKMGETVGMFRPPEQDTKADAEREQRERSVLDELRRIGDAVERRPVMQSAPVIGLEDGEKPASAKPRVN